MLSSLVAGKASSVSKGLQNVSVVQGEDALFTCEVTQASYTVKWAKESKAIKKSLKYDISQEGKIMKLTIHNVTAEDSGEYSCEVVGGATTRAKLEIKGETEDYVFTFFHLTVLFVFDCVKLFPNPFLSPYSLFYHLNKTTQNKTKRCNTIAKIVTSLSLIFFL